MSACLPRLVSVRLYTIFYEACQFFSVAVHHLYLIRLAVKPFSIHQPLLIVTIQVQYKLPPLSVRKVSTDFFHPPWIKHHTSLQVVRFLNVCSKWGRTSVTVLWFILIESEIKTYNGSNDIVRKCSHSPTLYWQCVLSSQAGRRSVNLNHYLPTNVRNISELHSIIKLDQIIWKSTETSPLCVSSETSYLLSGIVTLSCLYVQHGGRCQCNCYAIVGCG